ALGVMYLERTKRFSTASKFLWPIPDRGLKKRAYRIAAPTLTVWGESDRLIPPTYAKEFSSRIRNCREATIKDAGHMLLYEQQSASSKARRRVAEPATSIISVSVWPIEVNWTAQ